MRGPAGEESGAAAETGGKKGGSKLESALDKLGFQKRKVGFIKGKILRVPILPTMFYKSGHR